MNKTVENLTNEVTITIPPVPEILSVFTPRTLSNEMKEVLATLEKETQEQKANTEKMSDIEKDIWLGKMGIIEEIKAFYLTEASEIKKQIEVIEMFATFNSQKNLLCSHHLSTDHDTNPIIFSANEYEYGHTYYQLIDGQWFLRLKEGYVPMTLETLNRLDEEIYEWQLAIEKEMQEYKNKKKNVEIEMPVFLY